jgi:hypothetical protein
VRSVREQLLKKEYRDKPEEYCILTGQLRKSKEESVSGREESEASRGGAETTSLDRSSGKSHTFESIITSTDQ